MTFLLWAAASTFLYTLKLNTWGPVVLTVTKKNENLYYCKQINLLHFFDNFTISCEPTELLASIIFLICSLMSTVYSTSDISTYPLFVLWIFLKHDIIFTFFRIFHKNVIFWFYGETRDPKSSYPKRLTSKAWIIWCCQRVCNTSFSYSFFFCEPQF